MFLRQSYADGNKNHLMLNLPNRTWDAIKLHAGCLGLKQDYICKPEGDLSILLQGEPVSYYWMGFLLADGHFSKKRLRLALSNKDSQHVCKFANFIQCLNIRSNKRATYVSVQDHIIVPKINNKFNIVSNKTYNPVSIEWIDDTDLFLSLCIGIFDGDGCIRFQTKRKDCALTVKMHSSWLLVLKNINERICKLSGVNPAKPIINNRGYASVTWGNSILLKFLKRAGQRLSLPVLNRKWDRIDEHRIGRQERAKINEPIVIEMVTRGVRNKDIAARLGLSQSSVSTTIQKLKHKGLL